MLDSAHRGLCAVGVLCVLGSWSCGRLGYDVADSGDPSSPIDTAGMIALYHFDASSWDGSADEVIDSSGRGNHGFALNGVSTTPGKIGRAGSFERANDHAVNLGDAVDLQLNPPFSIVLWISLRSLPSSSGSFRLFSKSDANRNQREWALSLRSSDELAIATDSDGTGLRYRTVVPFTVSDIDAWVHVAVVVSAGGEVTGYRNGIRTGIDTLDPTIFHGDAAAFIGMRNPSGRGSDARVDELAVFTRALTPAEVLAIVVAQADGDLTSQLRAE